MVSVIIFYHEKDDYRRNNLLFIVDYINKLDFEKEIIVVEQGLVQKYDKSHFMYTEGEFNKSSAYNEGVRVSKYDNLMFSDSDIVMHPKIYKKALKSLDKYKIINPFRWIIDLNEEDTIKFKKDINFNFSYNEKRPNSVGTAGIFFIKKSVYNEVGGFDERCVGVGHEDDIFDIKLLLNDYKVHHFLNDLYHLYHPRSTQHFIPNNKNLFIKYLLTLYQTKIIDRRGIEFKDGQELYIGNDKIFTYRKKIINN